MNLIDCTKIRNRYQFARPLNESEAELLRTAVAWRKGSQLIRDEAGNVIACVCHPDDITEFRRELRQSHGTRISITVALADDQRQEGSRRIGAAPGDVKPQQ